MVLLSSVQGCLYPRQGEPGRTGPTGHSLTNGRGGFRNTTPKTGAYSPVFAFHCNTVLPSGYTFPNRPLNTAPCGPCTSNQAVSIRPGDPRRDKNPEGRPRPRRPAARWAGEGGRPSERRRGKDPTTGARLDVHERPGASTIGLASFRNKWDGSITTHGLWVRYVRGCPAGAPVK